MATQAPPPIWLGPTQNWDADALEGATRTPGSSMPTLDEIGRWMSEGLLAEAGIDPAAEPARAPAPPAPAPVVPERAPAPPPPAQVSRAFDTTGGVPMRPPAPPPPEVPVTGSVFVDTSRGTAGKDWLEEHPERQLPSVPANSPHLYGPGGGNYTQADYEGRANARRMIEAAYPDAEPFDPVKAQIEDLTGRADLALAERRAQDPVAFAELQAGLPERAKMSARLQASGLPPGETMYGFLAKIENQIGALEAELARRTQAAKQSGATPEAIEAASAPALAEIQRLKGHQLIMQQAMGFAVGQTPASLYQQGRY